MSSAQIDNVCEAVVAKILTDYADDPTFPLSADLVSFDYAPTISLNPENEECLRGMRVFVCANPDGAYGQVGVASRQADINEYTVQIVIYDIYTAEGRIPRDWIKARVDFVSRMYFNLGAVREYTILAEKLWPDSSTKAIVVDHELLVEHKVFRSEFTVSYREIA